MKSGWARQTISLVTYQGPTMILRVQGRKSLQAERAKKICTPMLTGHVIFDASTK